MASSNFGKRTMPNLGSAVLEFGDPGPNPVFAGSEFKESRFPFSETPNSCNNPNSYPDP